jgi:hypothetical protein
VKTASLAELKAARAKMNAESAQLQRARERLEAELHRRRVVPGDNTRIQRFPR